MGQLTLVLFRAVFAYGSSRYFSLFCFGLFPFVSVFETGSHCRGLGGTHRDPPAPLSQPPVLGSKALLFCSFETGSHYISLTGIHRTKYGWPISGWLELVKGLLPLPPATMIEVCTTMPDCISELWFTCLLKWKIRWSRQPRMRHGGLHLQFQYLDNWVGKVAMSLKRVRTIWETLSRREEERKGSRRGKRRKRKEN